MRYFAELAYHGANYCGWQRQPKQLSVQEVLEEALSLILQEEVEVFGCGRTDTGVHASQFFMHFDLEQAFDQNLLGRLNRYLPKDIVLYRIFEVSANAHARFDAYSRSYEYHLDFRKNPFAQKQSYYFPFAEKLNHDAMQKAAQLLLDYEEFLPFCKANSDAKTMRCELSRSEWVWHPKQHKMVFHITANRFLRGMVRLIVGMCLNVGQGKLPLPAVQKALDEQTRLEKSWSAPPDGLFLTQVRYPFLDRAT